ncbi:hypothetical protein CCACVL1_25973 [Corchorus capsularis]|uniref:Uncharacterized protein n=1 Tax=Corchorus capsularis TaxID=210143 RepID=A0A1R3GGA9_COCAP|nr:hypothetical protein CCACVL1_25973 [Corchorus capsularis]
MESQLAHALRACAAAEARAAVSEILEIDGGPSSTSTNEAELKPKWEVERSTLEESRKSAEKKYDGT